MLIRITTGGKIALIVRCKPDGISHWAQQNAENVGSLGDDMFRSLLLALALVGSSAFANVYSTQMTCAQAYNYVSQHGAVVIYESAHIYDRYVSHQGYCSNAGDEIAKAAWIRTSDNEQCFVGYTCSQDNDNGGN